MSKTIKYLGLATAALLLIIVSISTFAQSPSKRRIELLPGRDQREF